MKTLFFTLVLLFQPCLYAMTEIIANTSNGSTYVDPVHGIARINFMSDYERPQVDRGFCGKLIVIKREVDGKTVTERNLEANQTCEKIRAAVTAVKDCEEIPAYTLTIKDPDCSKNPNDCKKLAQPRAGTYNYCLKNNNSCNPDPAKATNIKIADEVKNCSPDYGLLVVKDTAGKHAAVSSLNDKEHCGQTLPRKNIATGNHLWDNENNPNFKVNVGATPGFYIGNHTHYFFDFNRQTWCIHFFQDPTRLPVCSKKFDGMTRTIAYPSGEKFKTKGVVKLSVKDGKPVAQIGHPTSEEFSYSPTLNENKAVMQVTLSNDEKGGRRSKFELKDRVNGSTLSQLDVSPTYSLGTRLASAGACSANSCIDVPVEVSGASGTGDKAFCKNNDSQLDIANSQAGSCYSCYGITPGPCGTDTVLITKDGQKNAAHDPRVYTSFSKISSDLKACRQEPMQRQDTEDATVNQ